jgi:hypothetical protein
VLSITSAPTRRRVGVKHPAVVSHEHADALPVGAVAGHVIQPSRSGWPCPCSCIRWGDRLIVADMKVRLSRCRSRSKGQLPAHPRLVLVSRGRVPRHQSQVVSVPFRWIGSGMVSTAKEQLRQPSSMSCSRMSDKTISWLRPRTDRSAVPRRRRRRPRSPCRHRRQRAALLASAASCRLAAFLWPAGPAVRPATLPEAIREILIRCPSFHLVLRSRRGELIASSRSRAELVARRRAARHRPAAGTTRSAPRVW